MVTKEVIVAVVMEDVDLGLNILATLLFTIVEKVLIVMGEVDIGPRPSNLPPIIQVGLVDHLVSLLMVIREVCIYLTPENFLPITMVDYTFSTQGSFKMIFLGVYQDETFKTLIKYVDYIHTKTTHIILNQECNHTLFLCVNISIILLFMKLMDLHNIHIYHPQAIYVSHHPFLFPPPHHQNYFILICVPVPQVVLLNTGERGGTNYKI